MGLECLVHSNANKSDTPMARAPAHFFCNLLFNLAHTAVEKDKIFFGDNGLTTTSANHCANLAKEAYQEVESILDNVHFYTTTVELISSDQVKTLRKGISLDDLSKVPSLLQTVAKYKSLIAWLREAIKAKQRLVEEANRMSDEDVLKELGLDVPVAPEEPKALSEDEVVASWGIKQRNRYYQLDTLCSVVGSYIHPSGSYAQARKALMNRMQEPNQLVGEGINAMLRSYDATVKPSQVDEMFFNLQNAYREAQAELNSMKHEIETTVANSVLKAKEEYSIAVDKYNDKVELLRAKASAFRKERVMQAQSLKIVIPDSLKEIYSQVNKLGKQ